MLLQFCYLIKWICVIWQVKSYRSIVSHNWQVVAYVGEAGKKEDAEGAWHEDTWPDVESLDLSLNIPILRLKKTGTWISRSWQMLAPYQHRASFTKSFILSGDGKFECRTPGQVGPTYQVLSEPHWCSYVSIASINTEVVSYTDKKM